MPTKHTDAQVALLLRVLDEAYAGKSWHGPNLRGSVRKMLLEEALWRPGPKRRCIAEIVVHVAYWKYSVRRRLRGDKRGSFPLKGSNWFRLPADMSERILKDYVALLDAEHKALREAVAGLSARQLGAVPEGSRTDTAKLVYGVAAHDVYHTGQIRLLKAMYNC